MLFNGANQAPIETLLRDEWWLCVWPVRCRNEAEFHGVAQAAFELGIFPLPSLSAGSASVNRLQPAVG